MIIIPASSWEGSRKSFNPGPGWPGRKYSDNPKDNFAEDDAVRGLVDFGDYLVFAKDKDRDAAMLDYTVEYENVLDDYIHPGEVDFYDDFDPSSSFPPKLSEYQYADMSVQPVITVDKATPEIFDQYKFEHDLITKMIANLPAGPELDDFEKFVILLFGSDSKV